MRNHPFYKIVDALDDTQKEQIVREYEQFKKDGQIGECLLRTTARNYLDLIAGSNANYLITEFMEKFAMECYKYFTEKYFALKSLNMLDSK